MLVNEVFNDDDEEWDYYYPRWDRVILTVMSPYRYNPNYGNGFRPTNGYNRPVNYQRGSKQQYLYQTPWNDSFPTSLSAAPTTTCARLTAPSMAARPAR